MTKSRSKAYVAILLSFTSFTAVLAAEEKPGPAAAPTSAPVASAEQPAAAAPTQAAAPAPAQVASPAQQAAGPSTGADRR